MTDHTIAPANETTTKRSAWDVPLGDVVSGLSLLILAAAYVPAFAEQQQFLRFVGTGLLFVSLPLNAVAGWQASTREPRDPDQTLAESWQKLWSGLNPGVFTLFVAAVVATIVAEYVTTGFASAAAHWAAVVTVGVIGVRRVALAVRSWATR
ncbi:hypothetical protein ACWGJ9_08085 [Curtobacterium citreum]